MDCIQSKGEFEHVVVCSKPNRYEGMETTFTNENEIDKRVRHSNVIKTRFGIVNMLVNYFNFYMLLKKTTDKERPDVVFVTSSRFITAYLGYRFSKKNGARMVLDIRDNIFLLLQNFLPAICSKLLQPFFNRIQSNTLSYAKHILLTSNGFLEYFSQKTSVSKFIEVVHGVPTQVADTSSASSNTIVYAGNIGRGQMLHKFIPDLAVQLPTYDIVIIGDGNQKEKLLKAIKVRGIKNVTFISHVSHTDLTNYYKEARFLLSHTHNLDVFKQLIPSKLYNYATSSKPIICCSSGYTNQKFRNTLPGIYFFEPFATQEVVKWIHLYKYDSAYDRTAFRDRYSSSKSNSIFYDIVRNTIA